MPNEYESEIRDLRNGDWYWVNKAVIQKYRPLVGSAGIAVYSFLASLVDKNQECFPSQKYIAQCLGYSRTTISRALRLLEARGLIKIEKRGRYHCIYHLLKIRCKPDETQMSNGCNSDVSPVQHNNNNKITININNIVNEDKNFLISKAPKGFSPKTREELLALDIARELNNLKSLPVYLSYAKKYPEPFLRKLLGEVKEIPMRKIRKGRAALFNYMVKKYGQKAFKNHRDSPWDKIFRDSRLSRTGTYGLESESPQRKVVKGEDEKGNRNYFRAY
jgi:biotin operon repressor